MQFIQKSAFSKNSLAEKILKVYQLKSQAELKRFLDENMKDAEFFSLLTTVFSSNFISVDGLKYTPTPYEGYVPFNKAARDLVYFREEDNTFTTLEKKELALIRILESLYFVEADVFLRLVKQDLGPVLNQKSFQAWLQKQGGKEASDEVVRE